MSAAVSESLEAMPETVEFVVTEESVIATLCRDACRDEHLRKLAQEAEIVETVEHTVRSLWADSRVKNFIAILALRDVRDVVGGWHQPSVDFPTLPVAARPRAVAGQFDDDVMTLSDDGSLE